MALYVFYICQYEIILEFHTLSFYFFLQKYMHNHIVVKKKKIKVVKKITCNKERSIRYLPLSVHTSFGL